MNQAFNLSQISSLWFRQLLLHMNTNSLKVAVAAIACASFVYAEPVDLAQLPELLFGYLINDPNSLNEFLAK
ncbi:hypothetical protein [Pontibacter sp. SGAir0037]|uniref:hypothetical protein n=1 Tax=Pontibacter sp. SGAir0037 TaxID=2571030 RepID=UPI0010CD6BCE|nr:hypothetical protein [Pontibacter sp. SGAir0037]QCR23835.1 hypothetical protein C1N53_16760 [Pontibacter sp. SGAir0037]